MLKRRKCKTHFVYGVYFFFYDKDNLYNYISVFNFYNIKVNVISKYLFLVVISEKNFIKFLHLIAINNIKFLSYNIYLWYIKRFNEFINIDFNNVIFFKDKPLYNGLSNYLLILLKVNIDIFLLLKKLFINFFKILKKWH